MRVAAEQLIKVLSATVQPVHIGEIVATVATCLTSSSRRQKACALVLLNELVQRSELRSELSTTVPLRSQHGHRLTEPIFAQAPGARLDIDAERLRRAIFVWYVYIYRRRSD